LSRGIYGNKTSALKRLSDNIEKLPDNIRNRLVLENCEMSYNIEDLLPISEKLNIPIIIDYHHDAILNSSQPAHFYHERVFNVWLTRCIKPKVHISNSVDGVLETDNKSKRRKHSDLINHFYDSMLKIDIDIDVMIEAKLKEQAIFHLRKLSNN